MITMKTIALLGTSREAQCIEESLHPAGFRVRQADCSDLDALEGIPLDESEPATHAQQRALLKARMAAKRTGLRYGVGIAGYMGLDPHMRVLPWAYEAIVWWDTSRAHAVFESAGSSRNHGARQLVWDWDGARAAAERAGFPDQALVVGSPGEPGYCRGIVDPGHLRNALEHALRDGEGAWVSVDLRAEFNPGRAALIRRVTAQLARRLAHRCETCGAAGLSDLPGVNASRQRLCHHCGALETQRLPARAAGSDAASVPRAARRGRPHGASRNAIDAPLAITGQLIEVAMPRR